MKKQTVLIVAGIMVTGLIGYFWWLGSQAKKLMDFTYSLKNFKFGPSNLKQVNFSVDLEITNPSNADFTIEDYEIDIRYNGSYLTTLKGQNLNTTLAANSSTSIPLKVALDPKQVSANLLQLLVAVFVMKQSTGEKSVVNYKGKVSGKFAGVGFKNIPIDYDYVIES